MPAGPSSALNWTGTDHAQTPFYIDPSIPPPGLDTEWQRLLDGAGNPGPIRVRLMFVYPFPGAEIDPAPAINGEGPPGRVFHYLAEVCMDAVPNPQNNPLLTGASVRGYWSADGFGPINRRNDSAVSVIQGLVPNGGCITMKRIPPEWGGVHGVQWAFFDPPGARYLMFGARYGLASFFAWSDAPCPAVEEIQGAANRPDCLLRSAHFLDYAWAGGTTTPAGPYDGQWAGNGTGTSSASTPARADVTFEISESTITTLSFPFTINAAAGSPQPSCLAQPRLASIRITNGTFTWSGGNTYAYTVNGTFTSPDAASGTIQIVPTAAAPAWCPAVTIAWTAAKGATTPSPTPTPTPAPSPGVVAVDDAYSMTRGSVLTIPAPGVLANDSVPAGVTPFVRLVMPLPSNVGFSNLGGGSIRVDLSNNSSFTGPLRFQYDILAAGTASNAATVTVTVN